MVEPLLKWAGGKRSLVDRIVGLLPADHSKREYHEPFFGGGALFFRLEPRRGTINDVNPRLINFYRVVRDDPEGLIGEASQYRYERNEFYRLRDRYNSGGIGPVEDAALTLYLNKTAYNGLYRVNSGGGFNVPFGRYVNPTIVNAANIRAASGLLRNVEIRSEDFSYIAARAEPGSICYLDPPYIPLSRTSNFTSYTAGGFTVEDHLRLRDLCVRLHERGVYFVLSNSYVYELVEAYSGVEGFRLAVVEANRALNSKPGSRGPVRELLVTNIPSAKP